MQALARLAVRRRWWVVAAWLLFIVGSQALSGALGGAAYKDAFKLPHTETETVSEVLSHAGLSNQNGANGTMVIHALSGNVSSHAAEVSAALVKVCSQPDIASITSPFGVVTCKNGAGVNDAVTAPNLISADKTIGLTTIQWTIEQPTLPHIKRVSKDLAAALDFKGQLQVEFTGVAFQELAAPSGGIPPEAIGFLAAIIILALVFRAPGAVVLPLASAIAAMGSGLALIALLSHVMNVANFAPQLAILMILGVGVDYALFIVTRHRQNLVRGMKVEDSIVVAVNTSGRAVLFAGITVCIALMGLWALGVNFLYGVSLGTAIGVALTMAASLSLLPALLAFLGLKVLPRKQRRAIRAGQFDLANHEGRWYRWSRLIQQRKAVFGIGAAALLVLLAIPFASIRLGSSDQGNDPTSVTTRKGYDLIAQGFGQGYNSALQLVIDGPGARDQTYLNTVTATLKSTPNVAASSIETVSLTDNVALITFKTEQSPQAKSTTDLVKNLRSTVLPPLYRSTANHIYVYGVTAVFVDFAKVLSAKMPIFFIAVVGLSFLLLLVAFRSVVIPLTAAVMNVLAAAASFGIITAMFQWGWGADALSLGGAGPIEPFVPVMFFAILFGLSMDYQVFLVSRIHEEWLHRRNNAEAITVGQGATGGIITAAALIMIAVFGGFILGDGRVIKLFGIGLASAIFLDAFVVRTVLVPAVMHAIGKANWFFPSWLDRVTPQLSIEADDVAEHANLVAVGVGDSGGSADVDPDSDPDALSRV